MRPNPMHLVVLLLHHPDVVPEVPAVDLPIEVLVCSDRLLAL